MAESGYKDEVARLRTSSNYVKVYSLILGDTISEIIKKDDINVDESISDLVVSSMEIQGGISLRELTIGLGRECAASKSIFICMRRCF